MISVIVAGTSQPDGLARWLAAFEPQRAALPVELLVAVNSPDAAAERLQRTHRFDLVVGPAGALVPDLWGRAMLRATGDIVVITIPACVPSPGWLAAIERAHRSPSVAIGGPIDIGRDASLRDRAVHLVRYTAFLPAAAAGEVAEIAGDNGTYKRLAIEDLLPKIGREGFWEPEIHHVLRQRGERLWMDPAIATMFSGSESVGGFSVQRYRHGRTFGQTRSGSMRGATRWMRVASAPLVPAVMLLRALTRMRQAGRLDVPTVIAAPLAGWFFTCWAA